MIAHRPQPIADTEAAIEFLPAMSADGPWHLVAIPPDQRPVAKSFQFSEVEEMTEWIDERQGKANIYFHVNRLRDGVSDVKAKKSDIAQATHLHVDIDDIDALERIQAFHPRPTAIVFSGGGYQAFWALERPTDDLDRVERCNAALAKALGGDHCHNIDRIMRLPGTINVPNRKKREAGRVPTLAKVVAADWSRKYSLDDFPEVELDPPPPNLPAASAAALAVVEPDQLPDAVSTGVRQLLELGDDADRPRHSETPRYPSRSEAVFHAACLLAKAGCTPETIAGLLINPKLGISHSILEKGRRSAIYALRQANAAHAAIADDWPDATKNGPRATLRNAALALRRMELMFAFDQFRRRKIVNGNVLEEHQGEVSDDACMMLRGMVIEKFGFDPRSENIRDAINLLCLENAFHPVRDEINALTWDGTLRLDRWMITYLDAEDTCLNEAFSRILLIAAVRRIRQPGVKFDEIVVLEGPQGSGKSTAVKILAGPGNHSDQEIITLDAKGQMELLEGVWFYELGELDGLGRAEANKIKAFASRTVDRSRMAYAHYSTARPRQTVFVGTTNDDKYLRDQTGNRRFWPVRTGTIDLEALRRDRDQLIAEAAHREAQGEPINLPEELWEAAGVEQAARLEDDPWIDQIEAAKPQVFGDTLRLYTHDLLHETLGIRPEYQNQGHTKRLANLMRKLGWEQKHFRVRDKTLRGYSKPKPADFVPRKRPKQEF